MPDHSALAHRVTGRLAAAAYFVALLGVLWSASWATSAAAAPKAQPSRCEVLWVVAGDDAARAAIARDAAAALEKRLAAFGVLDGHVVTEPDARAVRVEAPCQAGLQEVLERRGDLAFYLVDDSEVTFRALGPLPEGVAEDVWEGPRHRFRELTTEREELLAALPARLPAGRSLGIGRSYVEETVSFRFEAVVLDRTAAFDPRSIRSAAAAPLADGTGHGVQVALDEEGARALERFTAAHLGDRIAIVVDGEVEHTPKIREAIKGGVIQVSRCAWRGRADAPALARAYAAALAAPLPEGVSR